MRELAKEMEEAEPSKSKLEWIQHGELMTIGHVEVSAHALKEAITAITFRVKALLGTLTINANLNLEAAWREDQQAEKVDNRNAGFSPIKDRSDVLLGFLAKSSEISMCSLAFFPLDCCDMPC